MCLAWPVKAPTVCHSDPKAPRYALLLAFPTMCHVLPQGGRQPHAVPAGESAGPAQQVGYAGRRGLVQLGLVGPAAQGMAFWPVVWCRLVCLFLVHWRRHNCFPANARCSLKARGSRLVVLRGTPQEVLPRMFKVRRRALLLSGPLVYVRGTGQAAFYMPAQTWSELLRPSTRCTTARGSGSACQTLPPPPPHSLTHNPTRPTTPQEWCITRLCYEYDTEPYAKVRDAAVDQLARQAGVEVQAPVGHTLYVGL